MTLLIAMVNIDQAIMLADRRVIALSGSTPPNDESNKLTVFACLGARAGVAFSGLAAVGAIKTSTWLLELLRQACEPDHLIGPTLERLTHALTVKVASFRLRRNASRLTVLLAGYRFESPPRAFAAQISNFESGLGPSRSEANPSFELDLFLETRPTSDRERVGLIVTGCRSAAMSQSDEAVLVKLLQERRPAAALLGKGIAVIRAASRLAVAIGAEIGSVVLPANRHAEAVGE